MRPRRRFGTGKKTIAVGTIAFFLSSPPHAVACFAQPLPSHSEPVFFLSPTEQRASTPICYHEVCGSCCVTGQRRSFAKSISSLCSFPPERHFLARFINHKRQRLARPQKNGCSKSWHFYSSSVSLRCFPFALLFCEYIRSTAPHPNLSGHVGSGAAPVHYYCPVIVLSFPSLSRARLSFDICCPRTMGETTCHGIRFRSDSRTAHHPHASKAVDQEETPANLAQHPTASPSIQQPRLHAERCGGRTRRHPTGGNAAPPEPGPHHPDRPHSSSVHCRRSRWVCPSARGPMGCRVAVWWRRLTVGTTNRQSAVSQ